MTVTHSYPLNRFAVPDPSRITPVRTPRPSPARSSRAQSNKDGSADVKSSIRGQVRPDARAGNRDVEKRSILHLKVSL